MKLLILAILGGAIAAIGTRFSGETGSTFGAIGGLMIVPWVSLKLDRLLSNFQGENGRMSVIYRCTDCWHEWSPGESNGCPECGASTWIVESDNAADTGGETGR